VRVPDEVLVRDPESRLVQLLADPTEVVAVAPDHLNQHVRLARHHLQYLHDAQDFRRLGEVLAFGNGGRTDDEREQLIPRRLVVDVRVISAYDPVRL
jgi:hypothetical protein